ncbi:MAG: sulfatase-like hydrolase/transferase [Acidobacteria bacterium]|nr:sulfatase-like hydrolase/transferase [Acidobacteriota bacterium]
MKILPRLATLALLLHCVLQAAERPNVVFFISDDHGYLDSPVYGSRAVRTPNLEKIAAAGAKFTNAFVGSPSCAPSRAILLTGLMSARNGVEANHTAPREGLKVLPQTMDALGYDVALFGKVAHGKDPRWDPYVHDAVIRHGPLDLDLQPEKVVEYLEGRSKDRPAFLMVGTHSPHVYWPPNNGYDPKEVELPPNFIDTPETRRYRTMYYTDISLMDERLGVVYDAVRKHLGDNTLFVYTSDHGAQWPFGKWNLYDSGIRTPLLAVWPGVIQAGSVNPALVSFVDFLPTFVEMAGARPPGWIDGRSFLPVLRGESRKHRDEVYATHSGDGRMNVYPCRAIRTERYKLIVNLYPEFRYTTHIDKGKNPDGLEFWYSWEDAAKQDPAAARIIRAYHERPAEELFDLSSDPYEMHNLADDPALAALKGELRAKLDEWMALQNDQRKYFAEPRLLANPEEPAQGAPPERR